ncbi:MAG: histidinol dehydrogenase [Candidatus Heimdallarchaeota archaeon]|nr:histidinol dehydrogenase [Candidatus Heimdallarchaeota archaeon]
MLEFHLRGKNNLTKVLPIVEEIIKDVKEKGDTALLDYIRKFDKISLTPASLKASKKDISEAYEKLTKGQLYAIESAAKRIAIFHKKQTRKNWETKTSEGITTGQLIRSLTSVGIYVPGGSAAYPSTVLMCAIPAKIAGVERIYVCSPVREKESLAPALLVAADISGVEAVYKVGGAQAIAALAYGTHTIPKVDKIVGPGNKYVTAAKLAVNTDVAIDLPAGPSEIIIIADDSANPYYIAADLIAQAEHDVEASAILLTTSPLLATKVLKIVEEQVQTEKRNHIIKESLSEQGFVIIVKDLEEALQITNNLAPEHLSIQTKNPRKIMARIQSSGAIFLGKYSPVAFGDYSAGINHVLPTAGYAKIYSGLSVNDFYKTMNFLECSANGFKKLQDITISLAQLEGLNAHAESVNIRRSGESK